MHFGIQRVSSTLTAVCIRWVCKSFSRLQIILMLLSASLHFSALVPQEYQVAFLSAHKPSVQQFLLVFARDRCQAILSICVLRKHQMLTAQTYKIKIHCFLKDSRKKNKKLFYDSCFSTVVRILLTDFFLFSVSLKIHWKMQLSIEFVFENYIEVISLWH